MKKILFFIALLFSSSAWAASKPYDSEALAILRNGKPCFFLPSSIEPVTPSHLQGEGVQAELYAVGEGNVTTLFWGMWMKERFRIAPTSPNTCIPYGMRSRDQNRKRASPLKHDQPYYFSLSGEYGRFRVYFCLRKTPEGRSYLAKSFFDEKWKCSMDRL